MTPGRTPFDVEVVHLDGSADVRLTGELDVATAPILTAAIADLVGPHLRAINVDLAPLTFVDVTGMRSLDEARQIAIGAKVDYRVHSLSRFAATVLRLCQFHELTAHTDLTRFGGV